MAIRASRIILIYFVIGAVMFGGGAVTYDDSGVTQYFLTQNSDGSVSPASNPEQELEGVGAVISNLIGAFGGPAILVWNLVVGITSFLNWPVVVLSENAAPPRVTLILGGFLTGAFYLSLIRLVSSSS